MPIDPSIALSAKPIQLANPLEQYMQAQQIQQAQNQSRLADLMYSNQQRDTDQTLKLNDLYKNAVSGDGTIDRTKLYSGVASGGLGSRLPAIQKSFMDVDKAQADLDQAKATTQKVKTETAGMSDDQREKKRQRAITDIAGFKTPEEALASLDAHQQAGDLTPEAAAGVRSTIPTNPADFPKWQIGMLQRIMSAGDAMRQLAPDANTVANNATSRANNAATVAATLHGQSLTDARAREQIAAGKVPGGYRLGPNGTLVAIPGGPADQSNKPLTEFQGKSAAFSDRAREADTILNQLHTVAPTGLGMVNQDRPGVIKGIAESVPFVGEGLGAVVNTLPGALGGPNANQQKADQAQRNFINAILRQESGAVISPGEFDNARKQYFPQPGDAPDVIAQKAANRKTAINGLSRSAGPSYTPTDAPTGPSVPDDIAALIKKHGGK